VFTHRLGTLFTSVLITGALVGCGGGDGSASSSPSTPATTATEPAPSSTPPPTPDLSSLSAAQLSARSRAALDAARTFHVSMVATEKGETVAFDMNYGTTGSHGTFTIGGQKVQMMVIRRAFYIKAPDTFWRQQFGAKADRMLAILSQKWLKVSITDKEFADYAEFGTRDGFVRSFLGDWLNRPRKIGAKTINGIACLGLAESDGVLWVNKGDARPVQFESPKSSTARGRMSFSDYNTVNEPTAPPAATTIDVTRLRG